MPNTQPTRIEQADEGDTHVLYLQGLWRLAHAVDLESQVRALGAVPATACVIDGSQLQALDTSTGFLLLQRLREQGVAVEQIALRAMQQQHAELLNLVRERMSAQPVAASHQRPGLVRHVGEVSLDLWHTLRAHNAFVGHVAMELLSLLRNPRRFRFRATVAQFESVALEAMPIVALVTLLIGVVFAYLLGAQARRLGAGIFVVDGIALAMCRELSPILVAVIVAGRSGAAFTAQLGSMKVQEEVDAIRTLGLSPVQVLVIPRLLALIAGLPLLVFVGDLAGLGGGMLIAATQLNVSPVAFMSRLRTVLDVSDLFVGLIKAPAFAAFIAIIACRMGLSVERDARSVGVNTTSTVVQCIVWVILLNAVIAVTLQKLGF